MITQERWEVAKGGRSVNAGRAGKIRMEAGLPPEEIAEAMRLIAAAPDLLKVARWASARPIDYETRTLLADAVAKAEGRA